MFLYKSIQKIKGTLDSFYSEKGGHLIMGDSQQSVKEEDLNSKLPASSGGRTLFLR